MPLRRAISHILTLNRAARAAQYRRVERCTRRIPLPQGNDQLLAGIIRCDWDRIRIYDSCTVSWYIQLIHDNVSPHLTL